MKVSKTHIKPNTKAFKDCKELCIASANLYNLCIQYIQTYELENECLYFINDKGKKEYVFNSTHLYHQMKYEKEFKTYLHEDYIGRRINTKILKQVYFQVNRAYTGFFGAVKSYNVDKSKFKSSPKKPKCKKEQNVVVVPSDAYSVSKCKSYITISMTDIVIDVRHLKGVELKEIHIVPCTYGYKVTVLYDDGLDSVKCRKDSSRICGIDLGVNNFNSLAFNVSGITPFLISGKKLKHINHKYNEKLTKYRTYLPKGIYTSKKIKALTQKRNQRMDTIMHSISRYVTDFFVKHDIDTVVIGHNTNWKQNVNLGRNTNRRFCQIPFSVYIKMLTYKCEMLGIKVIVREESYTSKCSFIDNELVGKHESYVGKRVKRGLFRTGNGVLVNADINGALNIISKQFNECFNEPRMKYVSNIYKCIV